MPFTRILVAVDGSDGSRHAFEKALDLAGLTGAALIALAVEGPLPAYAATIGEVDEVKREKDQFFSALAVQARSEAQAAGVAVDVQVWPGHPAELIVHFAAEVNADLIVVGHKGH